MVRSSLCVFLAVVLTMVIFAPPASATVAPILTSTNPTSPGTSLEPRIVGNADGVITTVVKTRAILPRATEPGNTITIYTDPSCTGPSAATGTAAELESPGITVTVAPDSETTFYANETGLGGASTCSNGITYKQVTTAPAPPTFTGVTPASPANDNSPHLQGSAAASSIVYLYTNALCSGEPVALGTATQFGGSGIGASVADNSTTTFYAVASLAGLRSTCSSSSVTYQEVTPPEEQGGGGGSNGSAKPPAPHLRVAPGAYGNTMKPIVSGSAQEAASVKVFAAPGCAGGVVAKGSPTQLSAGFSVSVGPNTVTDFSARSVDSDGDPSACSDTVEYTEDSIAPKTRFTAGPGATTKKKTVVFRFADITKGPATSFLCKLDKKPWKACQAPLKLKGLGHKRHTLQVKAYDAAGNREKHPVKRSFQVVAGR